LDDDKLDYEFNINGGPLINGTKIIAFLDGNVSYENLGVPPYNTT
jgi:hypothetical protein